MPEGSLSDVIRQIRRGCVSLINEAELIEKLKAGRPLIVKAGFDPTAPELHLGDTVLLRKLRQFQDLGHKVIFLIGDATGLVGDPSGQTTARRLLTWEEVRANAKTYQDQAKHILLTDRRVFEVRYNSEWFLGRSPQNRLEGLEAFDFPKWVQLASKYTVARLLERDDFTQRVKAGKPLSVLELFYPLMQGYDSVKIAQQHGHCDIELGGTDQTFNLLVGRDLLKEYGCETQVVLTMPLLEGLDGRQKMSKSLGNHVGITEPPGEVFGKLMSIPDELIATYWTLLTDAEEAYIAQMQRQMTAKQLNPRDAKAELAETLVSMYHGPEAARQARDAFVRQFSERQVPATMPSAAVKTDEAGMIDLVEVLVGNGLAKTNNEARRLLRQHAVKITGEPVSGPSIPAVQGQELVLQVGSRHYLKLTIVRPAA